MSGSASSPHRPSEPEPDLSTLNPTGRFSDRVADYVKHRPDYPPAALAAALGATDPDPRTGTGLIVADVGAGTGISTRQLADLGARVIAVEPNADMRAAGETTANPLIRWQSGTAEATGLPAASVDVVVCAQAFHWFRQPEALAEFARILKPQGRVSLVWNCRDRNDAFTRGYTEAIVAIGGESRVETHKFEPGAIERSGRFEPVRMLQFPHAQRMNLEGLLGRALSASYVPKSGPGHQQIMAALRQLFAQHARDGLVSLRYRTEVYTARLR